jgi:hypothetical protein
MRRSMEQMGMRRKLDGGLYKQAPQAGSAISERKSMVDESWNSRTGELFSYEQVSEPLQCQQVPVVETALHLEAPFPR